MATLADLVDVLDCEVVDCPRGLAVAVGRPVLLDLPELASPGRRLAPDAVVLVVSDSPELLRIRDDADGVVPFSALIVRGELSPLAHDFALAAGAAVLRIPASTGWNDVLRRADRIGPGGGVERSADAIETMDLFGIADTAASIGGGAVTIEDSLHRIIAYSADQSNTDQLRIQTLLHRRTPKTVLDALRSTGMLRLLLTSTEPTVLRDIVSGAGPRIVVPIRSEGELLGLLWVALPAGAEEVDAAVLSALKRCGERAADHLVQIGGVLGRVRRVEVEQLARLLHSGDDGGQWGGGALVPGGVHWVMAIAFDLPAERRSHARTRVVHLLDRARLTHDARLVVGDLNDLLYVVVSTDRPDPALVAQLAGLVGGVPGTAVGISSTTAPDLPQGRVQAERALSVARRAWAASRTAMFDEVWATAALVRLAASPLAAELAGNGPIRRLLARDAEGGTEYASTLREYLLVGGDTRLAAERLTVHVNTVRYRIAKIRDEFGIDIDDPQARLVMTLQLVVLQLQQG